MEIPEANYGTCSDDEIIYCAPAEKIVPIQSQKKGRKAIST